MWGALSFPRNSLALSPVPGLGLPCPGRTGPLGRVSQVSFWGSARAPWAPPSTSPAPPLSAPVSSPCLRLHFSRPPRPCVPAFSVCGCCDPPCLYLCLPVAFRPFMPLLALSLDVSALSPPLQWSHFPWFGWTHGNPSDWASCGMFSGCGSLCLWFCGSFPLL